uniref:penicillin acylase family protein n=1 Tax=Penaeicola halotolerans TaxID=2793196 RepID=UPI001CF9212A
DSHDEYKYDGKRLKTQKRIEEIKVKGGETFYDTLVYTHHGPVVYDRNFKGEGQRIN